MKTIIKKRIEILAELRLCTYAELKSYVENTNNVFGIIKYDVLKTCRKIGFRYQIKEDRLILIDINEMTKQAYYTICKY